MFIKPDLTGNALLNCYGLYTFVIMIYEYTFYSRTPFVKVTNYAQSTGLCALYPI